MKTTIVRTTLWLAMTAVAVNGHALAEELVGVPPGETLVAMDEAPAAVRFSQEQVEQMVAPVALYPDALLAQVMMAATYPLEIAQADQWLAANRGLEGEALDTAVAAQPWDPSIKTLVFFPDVLARLADDLSWTQDLGDAFLAQEADVMGAVQRLRREARAAGNLESNAQQLVRTAGSNILVEPADPATLHVPSYNPTTVYGSSWTPTSTYYPDTYGASSSLPTWVVFGAGAVVGALLVAAIDWADDDDYYVVHHYHWPRRRHHHHIWYHGPMYWSRDWHGPRYGRPSWRTYRPTYVSRGDVYIDNSRTVNIDKTVYVQNNVQVRKWEHDPKHRRTVSYRDSDTARRYLQADDGPRLDRGTVRRLDRSKPAALPADRDAREALKGDALERRDRIRGVQKDIAPPATVEQRPEAAEAAQRRLRGDAGREGAKEDRGGRGPKTYSAAPGADKVAPPRPDPSTEPRRAREGPKAQLPAPREAQRRQLDEATVAPREQPAARQAELGRRASGVESRANAGQEAAEATRQRRAEPPWAAQAAQAKLDRRRAETAATPQAAQEPPSRRQAEAPRGRSEIRAMAAPRRSQEDAAQRQTRSAVPRAEPRQASPRERPRLTERKQPSDAAPVASQPRDRGVAQTIKQQAAPARGNGDRGRDREQRNRQRDEDTAQAGGWTPPLSAAGSSRR